MGISVVDKIVIFCEYLLVDAALSASSCALTFRYPFLWSRFVVKVLAMRVFQIKFGGFLVKYRRGKFVCVE